MIRRIKIGGRQMKAIGLALTLFIGCASAQQRGEEIISSQDAESIANMLSTCAGIWDALSEAASLNNTPATAEQLHNLGNGAETAAMWVLASQHALLEKQKTTYGSWSELTRPKRESGKTMLLAMSENSQQEEINQQIEVCRSALDSQEEILQMMRKDRVRTQQEETFSKPNE